jgi:hypothetical protein
VVYRDAAMQTHLYEYDSAGPRFLGDGVLYASKAFTPRGAYALDVVYAGGTAIQYTPAGSTVLVPGGRAWTRPLPAGRQGTRSWGYPPPRPSASTARASR